MQVFLVILFCILGLVIQYFLIKIAVANGSRETYNDIELYNHVQMRKAVKNGIKEALADDDSKLLKELQDTITKAIKSANDQGADL